MTPNVRFREAQESDAADLACLIDSASHGLALWLWSTLRASGQATIEVGRNRIRTLTASPHYYGAFIIAEAGGAIAGALTGRLLPIPYERGDAADLPDAFAPVLELEAVAAGSWYLNVVSVYSEFRGQGLGSALLGKAEEIARLQKASRMSLIVGEANAGALKLYLRHGFAEWTRRPYMPFPGSMEEVTGSCSRKSWPDNRRRGSLPMTMASQTSCEIVVSGKTRTHALEGHKSERLPCETRSSMTKAAAVWSWDHPSNLCR